MLMHCNERVTILLRQILELIKPNWLPLHLNQLLKFKEKKQRLNQEDINRPQNNNIQHKNSDPVKKNRLKGHKLLN